MNMSTMMSVVIFLAVFLCCTLADMEVTTAAYTTCASYNGQAKCWGSNRFGKLGLGDTDDRYEPPAEPIDLGTGFAGDKVRCGTFHCCALSDAKRLKCWGLNEAAGFEKWRGGRIYVGGRDGDMGDDLEYLPFEDVDDFATYQSLTCVLTEGEVKCFGNTVGENSPLGNDVTGETKSAQDAVTLDLDGFAVDRLGGGFDTVCVISSENDIKCLGSLDDSEFSHSFQVERVECGEFEEDDDDGDERPFCCALSGGEDAEKDILECWGSFPIRFDLTFKDFTIASRDSSSAMCALRTNNDVWCIESDGDVPIFSVDAAFTASDVRLAHGMGTGSHFCVYEYEEEKKLQCWGLNGNGQLGYGDTVNREGGANLDDVDLGCWTDSVYMSNFIWGVGGPNGVWEVVPGVYGWAGTDVYSKSAYGTTIYMWRWPFSAGWGAWAIGYDYTGADIWGWRWGDNLLDCADNPNNYCFSWQWYFWGKWYDDDDATVDCLTATDVINVDMSISDGPIPNGTNTIPTFEGASSAAVSPLSEYGVFPEIAAGVAVSVMILVAIAIAVSVRRKRNDCPQTGGAVHVPEVSPMDIAVQIEMGKEAVGSVETVTAEIETGNEAAVEMEDDGAADVVVDDVAPKPDEAVSVGHEQ